MDPIEVRRGRRFEFLKAIYEATGGSSRITVNLFNIGSQLGMTREETIDMVYYFRDEGLTKTMAMGGFATISHEGILEYENVVTHKEIPTSHFPSYVNIVNNLGTITGSQLQQGTTNSQQRITNKSVSSNIDELKEFSRELKELLKKINLDSTHMLELESEAETIQAQVKSPLPKNSILKEAVGSVRQILEGAGGELIADFLKKYGVLLTSLLGG